MPKPQTPQTLTGLAKLLGRHGNRAFVVPDAEIARGASNNRVIIVTDAIPEFGRVRRQGNRIRIGTGATFGRVLREVDGENGLVQQAISMMANPLVRNRVTVMMALEPESPYFDLATALVTLGAKVRVQSTSGSRLLGVSDYLMAAASGLKAGEFPAAVEFRPLDREWRVGFFRVNPGANRNTVSASLRMRVRRNLVVNPEIAVSSSTLIPVVTPLASAALDRRPLTENTVKHVAETASREMLDLAGIDNSPYESSLIEGAVARAIRRAGEPPG